MTAFLQLVNDVERESGIISASQRLTTVASATGKQEKIVGWTRQAWEMIQRERTDWTFRRKQFSHALTVSQTHYTAAQLGITDFAGWGRQTGTNPGFSLYDPALGRGDETTLPLISYASWLAGFDIGSPDSVRPNQAAISFEHAVALGPPPDKAYVLRGWYRRAIQKLTDDDDEPYIDEEYHQAIVWRALMLLAEDGEAGFAVATSSKNYASQFSAMLGAYLEPIEMG